MTVFATFYPSLQEDISDLFSILMFLYPGTY